MLRDDHPTNGSETGSLNDSMNESMTGSKHRTFQNCKDIGARTFRPSHVYGTIAVDGRWGGGGVKKSLACLPFGVAAVLATLKVFGLLLCLFAGIIMRSSVKRANQ